MSNHPKEGAKYQILVENIRREIHEGKYQTGDKLMSENQLSAQYGLSKELLRQQLPAAARISPVAAKPEKPAPSG